MYKYVFLLFLNIVLSGILITSNVTRSEYVPEKPIVTQETFPQRALYPETLVIPKLNVSTSIERVGHDSEGNMDVPKDYLNVGWYRYGPMPGQTGNSVIAGHVDTATGPAIFYNLSSLDEGDIIQVIDEDGNSLEFEVYRKEMFKYRTFPIDTVFGESGEINLNLITCAGIFDRTSREYLDRLVIFTKLKN